MRHPPNLTPFPYPPLSRPPPYPTSLRTSKPRVPRDHHMPSALATASSRSRSSGSLAIPSSLPRRSEEHTSELQSQSNLVCRLLLEKKTEYDRFIDERDLHA